MKTVNRARYERWKERNPEAMRLFRQLAREKLVKYQRFGIKALIERVRWDYHFPYTPDEHGGFKIANAYAPLIARELVAEMPGLKDLIRLNPSQEDFE